MVILSGENKIREAFGSSYNFIDWVTMQHVNYQSFCLISVYTLFLWGYLNPEDYFRWTYFVFCTCTDRIFSFPVC